MFSLVFTRRYSMAHRLMAPKSMDMESPFAIARPLAARRTECQRRLKVRDVENRGPFGDSQISSGRESCRFETVRTDRQTIL